MWWCKMESIDAEIQKAQLDLLFIDKFLRLFKLRELERTWSKTPEILAQIYAVEKVCLKNLDYIPTLEIMEKVKALTEQNNKLIQEKNKVIKELQNLKNKLKVAKKEIEDESDIAVQIKERNKAIKLEQDKYNFAMKNL